MIKYYWTMVLFLLGSTWSQGQSYTIKTAEGKSASIQLNGNLTTNELKVISGSRCRSIQGFTGIQDKPELVNGGFLKVSYSVSSASGAKMRYIVLYGIQHKQLYEALHILSEYSWEEATAGTERAGEQGYYKALLQFESNATIIADIFREHTSKESLMGNYINNTKATLTLDKQSKTFITAHKQLKGRFTLISRAGTGTSDITLDGTYPAIILEHREYYYINNTWYEKGTKSELIACSHQGCN